MLPVLLAVACKTSMSKKNKNQWYASFMMHSFLGMVEQNELQFIHIPSSFFNPTIITCWIRCCVSSQGVHHRLWALANLPADGKVQEFQTFFFFLAENLSRQVYD